MFKPFFVHINPHPPGKMNSKHPRGATVYVSPVDNDPTRCRVQVALCSPKDEFNKTAGRVIAMVAEPEYTQKRNLPMWIAEVDHKVAPWLSHPAPRVVAQRYMYLLRNFL
jgi:hypothetical protein